MSKLETKDFVPKSLDLNSEIPRLKSDLMVKGLKPKRLYLSIGLYHQFIWGLKFYNNIRNLDQAPSPGSIQGRIQIHGLETTLVLDPDIIRVEGDRDI